MTSLSVGGILEIWDSLSLSIVDFDVDVRDVD